MKSIVKPSTSQLQSHQNMLCCNVADVGVFLGDSTHIVDALVSNVIGSNSGLGAESESLPADHEARKFKQGFCIYHFRPNNTL